MAKEREGKMVSSSDEIAKVLHPTLDEGGNSQTATLRERLDEGLVSLMKVTSTRVVQQVA